MPLLFWEAKQVLSKFAGKGGYCPGGNSVDSFVMEVLQYMLYEGTYGNERKFCFQAQNGCITIPEELETPLKVKIDGRVGSVWDKWYEFHSTAILDNCLPAEDALFEDPNKYATIYDIPKGGKFVGITATRKEDESTYVIVQGKDVSGRQIITMDGKNQIVGEKIIPCWGDLRYTKARFAQVDAIIKSRTSGYIEMYWYDPKTYLRGYLSTLSPLEEKPAHRRFRLTSRCGCKGDGVKVSVVGRIRLKEQYTDFEYIPFDNRFAMSLAGQTINASYKDKIDIAVGKSKLLNRVIDKENAHKKVTNGSPVEVYGPTSGGSIKPLF